MDQLNLFPLADLKTEGYAQPESRAENVAETDEVEIEDAA